MPEPTDTAADLPAKRELAELQTQRSLFKRMRKAILDGDWPEVDKLAGKMSFQQQKSLCIRLPSLRHMRLISKSLPFPLWIRPQSILLLEP